MDPRTTRTKNHKLLVIEDNELNREILCALLQDEYEIMCAQNGKDGITMLKQYREEISLIILDVYMPVMDGFEFLTITQQDPYLSSVPVIVATGSEKHEDEEKCLRLGATDFITKPYQPEAIISRVHNIIRYRDTLSTLAVVEYDDLTDCYTMSAFLHHMQQRLNESSEPHDLIAILMRDFGGIRRMYGEKRSQDALRYVVKRLKEMYPDAMIARQDDTFYMLKNDHKRLTVEEAVAFGTDMATYGPVANLRLAVGLYYDIDRTQTMEIICDRAKNCLRMNQEGYMTHFYYNEAAEQHWLREQELLLNFETCLANHEFVVYFQPKVHLQTGEVKGAEALVRWYDAQGRIIPPTEFIPLLEREDLIGKLDEYVYETVCEFQQIQRMSQNQVVPISVNLSRNSLYQKNIIEHYRSIAAKYDVPLSLVPLEITESATVANWRITSLCETLVQAGFTLHMDDFGSGYSSLSSLTSLPFHVLKLDKSIIDTISTRKGYIILKTILNMTEALGVEVVAEGVESQMQLMMLSQIGCHMVQGYYFSEPIKEMEFVQLMRKEKPFSQKALGDQSCDSILRLTQMEMKQYLKMCKQLFPFVRLVEPTCCKYCMAKKDGSLESEQDCCYGFWKRHARCTNCISLKTLESKQTEYKFEILDGEIYLAYSTFVEVEGEPRALELLSLVGNAPIQGYLKDKTLFEVLKDKIQQ